MANGSKWLMVQNLRLSADPKIEGDPINEYPKE